MIHCDLRKDNIIISQKPSRVAIIDFEISALRVDESDSKWESAATEKREVTRVKQLLHKAGIRYLDPCY